MVAQPALSAAQAGLVLLLQRHAYLKDVMQRLPTQPASRIGELLPHRWQPLLA
ncbi:hypothetical protein Rta_30260 [Ramlibacter tataouinensis TTB310]|uniref:Transposase IS66 C-terminal domain-containing protein n=1 Tax=Ramlibacter tataouinensis (strain ATCC BAA-407 / DSM 14655 / LMG 21543 / TTB310) TaxID=365046 RepID=F5XW32_RAMTT|nr:hypothetical protein Rta_30260 [Ramlibacter tataouinensis TTB310]